MSLYRIFKKNLHHCELKLDPFNIHTPSVNSTLISIVRAQTSGWTRFLFTYFPTCGSLRRDGEAELVIVKEYKVPCPRSFINLMLPRAL